MKRCDGVDEAEAIEAARVARASRLRRRARRRAFALGAAAGRDHDRRRSSPLSRRAGRATPPGSRWSPQPTRRTDTGESYEQGFVRAERDFDLTVDRRDVQDSPDGVITDLAAGEIDLVILDPIASRRTGRA